MISVCFSVNGHRSSIFVLKAVHVIKFQSNFQSLMLNGSKETIYVKS